LTSAGSVIGADDPLSATRFVTVNELSGDAAPANAATNAAIAMAAVMTLTRIGMFPPSRSTQTNTMTLVARAAHPCKREGCLPG
jgi:hypothetical protein